MTEITEALTLPDTANASSHSLRESWPDCGSAAPAIIMNISLHISFLKTVCI